MKKSMLAAGVMIVLLLNGCGGGSANQPPVAQAGGDRVVAQNTAVTLTGTGIDSDGSITGYQWKEGSTVLGSSAQLTYTPSSLGDHSLTLTVTDNDGASAADTVHIRAVSSGSRIQKLLVVRIEFADRTFVHDVSVWRQKIFGAAPGELNHYYDEISGGSFQFDGAEESDGVPNGIVTAALSGNHPGNDDAVHGDYHMWGVFKNALIQANTFVDFSAYDRNHDGAISSDELQIMFLVAGGESSSTGNDAQSIWALKSCYFGSSGITAPPTLDGVELMGCGTMGNFSRFGERHFLGSSNESDATIGVIAHELGHAVFGLPDLYDADGLSGGIGDFGLMAGGSWGTKPGERPGATPAHMTGWSKLKAGFVTPTLLSADTTGTSLSGNDDAANYKLYRVNTTRAGEYYLLENRPASGYDLGLSGLAGLSGPYTGGLAIMHIDENQLDNTNPAHKRVDIVEANAPELDLASPTHNRGHIKNLFYAPNRDTLLQSDTKQYDGTTTGIEVTNVSASGAVMTADIKVN